MSVWLSPSNVPWNRVVLLPMRVTGSSGVPMSPASTIVLPLNDSPASSMSQKASQPSAFQMVYSLVPLFVTAAVGRSISPLSADGSPMVPVKEAEGKPPP